MKKGVKRFVASALTVIITIATPLYSCGNVAFANELYLIRKGNN